MAATARTYILCPVTDMSLRSFPVVSRHLTFRPSPPAPARARQLSGGSCAIVSCLVSGVDGGGVSDDFVSTRNAGFTREFSVIAAMLKRIEPLDTSLISKGVSDAAKDSMKQTISTMLGLLPSDHFSITVRVSKRPLHRLLASSIITGYTLWNAEYRTSLMRNFDISPDSLESSSRVQQHEALEVQSEKSDCKDGEIAVAGCVEELERVSPHSLGDLSAEALNYIQQLESDLLTAKKELNAKKQEYMQMENNRENDNDLLEYLRSLEPEMVMELSRPSSLEVEEIIHQLVQNILGRFFKDDNNVDLKGDSVMGKTHNYQNGDNGSCDIVDTSRDYLAKLLFWCMLLGHHLRGLENRLHLSCVVGLL